MTAFFMKKTFLYLFIAIALFLFSNRNTFSQPKTDSYSQKYREILLTAESLNLGFPFNDVKHLSYDKYTMTIGENIATMHQKGFLSEKIRKEVLMDIVDSNWKAMKKLPLEGYLNIGYLQSEEPESDVYLLFAALVVLSKTGEIEHIAPFLELSKIYFGSETEAFHSSPIVDSIADIYFNKDLSEDLSDFQRKSFWPASSAILNHATTTIPLLIKAVQDTKLAELLRLRAAAYLREMAPDVLNEEFIGKCEEPIAKKIQCILDKKATWDGVGLNICDPYDEKYIKLNQKRTEVFDSMRKNRTRVPDPRK